MKVSFRLYAIYSGGDSGPNNLPIGKIVSQLGQAHGPNL